MLLLHEVHTVAGKHEDEFEAAFRDGWMPKVASDDDARPRHRQGPHERRAQARHCWGIKWPGPSHTSNAISAEQSLCHGVSDFRG